jgi:hypothetical protein
MSSLAVIARSDAEGFGQDGGENDRFASGWMSNKMSRASPRLMSIARLRSSVGSVCDRLPRASSAGRRSLTARDDKDAEVFLTSVLKN